jgi:hypothetical protein
METRLQSSWPTLVGATVSGYIDEDGRSQIRINSKFFYLWFCTNALEISCKSIYYMLFISSIASCKNLTDGRHVLGVTCVKVDTHTAHWWWTRPSPCKQTKCKWAGVDAVRGLDHSCRIPGGLCLNRKRLSRTPPETTTPNSMRLLPHVQAANPKRF